ncbi:28772_t:CDS:2, partial [Gigaspora margarita]
VKKEFGLEVHPTTIGHLIKNKDDIGDNLSTKRQKIVQYPDLENTLFEWILQNQNQIIISDAILIEKAKKFAKLLNIPDSDFKFSYGWLYKFKRRHELGQIKKHGEDASVDNDVVADAIPKLREFIFSLDFFSILILKFFSSFSLEPDTTLATICLQDEKLNVLNAIKFIVRAWREVSSETIKEKETNEVLNDKKILAIVTNIESEKTEKEDDSTEMHQITHHEVLSAVEVLEQYLMQQDIGEVARSNHGQALSNLQEKIKKLRNSSFKQMNIKTFFELVE